MPISVVVFFFICEHMHKHRSYDIKVYVNHYDNTKLIPRCGSISNDAMTELLAAIT